MFTIKGKTELNQWEQNVSLTNPNMAVGDAVRFVNGSGKTIIMYAYDNGGVVVDIPNIMLQHNRTIVVDLIDDVKDCSRFPVVAQEKPADYKFEDNVKPAKGSAGGGVSAEEVTTIVKEQFLGGVGYSEVGEVELFNDSVQNGAEIALVECFLEVGKEYTVSFDGVIYSLTAQYCEGGVEIVAPYEEGETPLFSIFGESGMGMGVFISDRFWHELIIHTTGEVVHKVDGKYLQFVVEIDGNDDVGYTLLTPSEKVRNALENGLNVVAYTPTGYYPLTHAIMGRGVKCTFGGLNMYSGETPEFEFYKINGQMVTHVCVPIG